MPAAIVFLGGGRITSAIVAGLRLAGHQDEIVVYDRNPEKLRKLRGESGIKVARDLKRAVEQAGMLIVAVRPAGVMELLDNVATCGARIPKLCVSLAAGIPLKKLRDRLGVPTRWARAMPSPVCRVGRGLTAITFERSVSGAARSRVRGFFEKVGAVLEIPESQFDAFTAIYSSSHGYHALGALAKAGGNAGLDRATALTAAAHALADGIEYWRSSGHSLADLLAEAVTPGGIAEATMSAANKSGYSRAVERGIRAGITRAKRTAGR